MEWMQYIDGYCERLAPGVTGEPLNALSNLAFLLAAYVMWRRVRGENLPIALVLVLMLAAIGAGSLLFHTFATRWAALADIAPIGAFSLFYIYVANHSYLKFGALASLVGVALYLPFSVLVTMLLANVPFVSISSFYWPLTILIFVYAFVLRGKSRQTADGLALGGAILALSLIFRSLDHIACERWIYGTHFVWHLLNAIMLGWMIEVYRRHMLEARKREG